QQLHDDVEERVRLLSVVEDAEHVAVIEAARGERLAIEPGGVLLAVLELRVQHLHCDRAPKGGVLGAIDLAARAAAEEALEAEASVAEGAADERSRRASRDRARRRPEARSREAAERHRVPRAQGRRDGRVVLRR